MAPTGQSSRSGGGNDAPGLVADAESCHRRLSRADAPLVVTLDETPREWLADCEAAVRPSFVATYPHPDCVRTVADPGNLPAVAAAVHDFLRAAPDAATPEVCVDTLDPVCEYAGRRRAERWLAVVAGRVAAAGGTLHCHDRGTDLPHDGVFFER